MNRYMSQICKQWYFTKETGHLKWRDANGEVFTCENPLRYDKKSCTMVLGDKKDWDGTEVSLIKSEQERSVFLKQQTCDWLAKYSQK